MNDYILFKNLDDKYLTLPELLKEDEKQMKIRKEVPKISLLTMLLMLIRPLILLLTQKKKDERKPIYYVTDPVQQGQYIKMFKGTGHGCSYLKSQYRYLLHQPIRSSVMRKFKFMRIDADLTDSPERRKC